jgi:hypothetical protein
MRKIIVLLIGLMTCAHAGFYFSGGLGMIHNNDGLQIPSSTTLNGGEAQYSISANMGYQPFSNTKPTGSYFYDLGFNYALSGDNVLQKSGSTSYEVRDDLELVLRVGSMFEASQRTFPYVFLAGVYDLSVKLDNGPLSTSESKDLFGYGAGVGIRSFAGEHGFYDFSYMYHQASETSLGTYSADSSKANFEMDRGVFTAAIGYMF